LFNFSGLSGKQSAATFPLDVLEASTPSLSSGFGLSLFLPEGLEPGLTLNELRREFDLETDMTLEACPGFSEFNKFNWDFRNGET